MAKNTAKNAALSLARERGWYILRVHMGHKHRSCNGGVTNCKEPSFPGGWDSSNDPAVIEEWDWSASNAYAIDCDRSGLLAVDVDPGAEWPFESGFAVKTGRGKHHVYRDLIGLATRTHVLPWKVDTRGLGGIIFGPGSHHPHGEYELISDGEITDPPLELMDAIQRKRERELSDDGVVGQIDALDAISRLEGVYRRMSEAQVGQRNDTLNKMAGTAAGLWVRLDSSDHRGELSEDVVKQKLLSAVPNDDDPAGSRKTIDSGWLHGLTRPIPDDAGDATVLDFPSRNGVSAGQGDEPDSKFALDVAYEAHRIRVRDAAKSLVRAEEVGSTPPPPAVSGREFLAQVDDERHLVDGLIPRKGKFLMAAAAKAGKTTTIHHVVAALLSGGLMFNEFPVDADKPLNVHLIDNEMGDRMLRQWLSELGLSLDEQDRLTVHSLLGYASTFDPTSPESRAVWAERLEGADVVIVDCLSPFMQAIGLDENHDAGRWLVGIDELMAAAGVDVYGVVHHTGHEGERARGDSKILGWPFQTWTLNRDAGTDEDDDVDDAPRFLKARGRCGSIASGQLIQTPEGLRYVAGVSRTKVRAETRSRKLLDELLDAIPDGTEWFGAGAAGNWVGVDSRTVRKALCLGVDMGKFAQKDNPNGSGVVFREIRVGGHGR